VKLLFKRGNNNMKRIIILLIIALVLISCKRENSLQSIEFITNAIQNEYDILFLKTLSYEESQNSHKDAAVKLRSFANQVLEYGIDDNEKLTLFENYAYEILAEYSLKYDNIILMLNNIKKDERFYVKCLEFAAINSISNDLFLNSLDLNWVAPMVFYDPFDVRINESFQANIFLAANNFKIPIKVIVDSDTLKERDPSGVGYVFEYKPLKKGSHIHYGTVLLDHQGDKYSFDFQIKYNAN
jgi:hypothetical protein